MAGRDNWWKRVRDYQQRERERLKVKRDSQEREMKNTKIEGSIRKRRGLKEKCQKDRWEKQPKKRPIKLRETNKTHREGESEIRLKEEERDNIKKCRETRYKERKRERQKSQRGRERGR